MFNLANAMRCDTSDGSLLLLIWQQHSPEMLDVYNFNGTSAGNGNSLTEMRNGGMYAPNVTSKLSRGVDDLSQWL